MSSTIKIIIEKGPREGETLEYSSAKAIKIGRVVRGNTIAIKDAGISTKHISIQFDNQLLRWTLIDLDSSNGTILNGLNVKPHVSSCLSDGDCIKIGELTSMIVKIEPESGLGFDEGKAVEELPQKRNLRPRGRKVAVKEEVEVVQKRDLRSRGKKGVDVKIEVESLSCKRVLRSSKKGENMNVDVTEMGENVKIEVESKKTRRGRNKLLEKVVEDSDLDGGKLVENGVPVQGKGTGRGRSRMKRAVESLDANESVQVGERNEGDFDKGIADLSEKVENTGLVEKLDTNNECVEDELAEKLVLRQEGCEGKEAAVDGSLIKSPSKKADMDKGKEAAAEVEYRQDGCKGLVNDSGPAKNRWVLEKMTLGDFFDYMEEQLPKEIREKIEKISADLRENAWKCHEYRLQINENRKGNIATG